MIRPGEIVIDESNYGTYLQTMVNGEWKINGTIPRDYSAYPVGSSPYSTGFRAVPPLPLIPRSEWPERIKEKVANKSQLSDIRLRSGPNGGPIPSLDQNGKGYCWAHSTTHAVMMMRAVMGLPYVPLSAYAVACIIKQYRDQGGWGAQSMDFACDKGIPSQEFWPQQSMSPSNDKQATWDNAKLHRVQSGWIDLDVAQYDRKLTFDQVATLSLSNIPTVGDFNWWGHSVCILDLVETSPGQFGVRIWNSWSDSWSDRGTGVLAGSKAIPDGAVAPRLILASAA